MKRGPKELTIRKAKAKQLRQMKMERAERAPSPTTWSATHLPYEGTSLCPVKKGKNDEQSRA